MPTPYGETGKFLQPRPPAPAGEKAPNEKGSPRLPCCTECHRTIFSWNRENSYGWVMVSSNWLTAPRLLGSTKRCKCL